MVLFAAIVSNARYEYRRSQLRFTLATVHIANALEHEQFGPEPGAQGHLDDWRTEAAKVLELPEE
jgi:hypothetical protein